VQGTENSFSLDIDYNQ